MAAHWFNPLVWVAYRFIGKDLEMYCDESVLRGKGMGERKRYSNTLLEFASKSSGLPLVMRFGESDAEHRIRHILYGAKKPRRVVSILLAILAGAGGIFFLTARNVEGNGEANAAGQDIGDIKDIKIEALLAEEMALKNIRQRRFPWTSCENTVAQKRY